MSPSRYDVIVVGAGPAGSIAAALLAERGLAVLLLERERFPRYHVGESLLPLTHYAFKRLGLLDKLRSSAFVQKRSAQFVLPNGKASHPVRFATRYPAEIAQTWQVLRSEFDSLLLANAREKGTEVREETKVTGLLLENGVTLGVRAQQANGSEREFQASMTLDCSGREALTATSRNWRIRDPKLNKVAVWTYYRGALRDTGRDAGSTTIAFLPEKNWFWYIPLHQDMVSVGVVAEGKYLSRGGVREAREMFHREVEQNPWIKEHLASGTQIGRYYLTSEFSWRSRHCAADGLLVAGDALGFLDPVFSSGVLLALKSGCLAADAISAACASADFSAARFTDYGRTMHESVENMRKLVYAFYQPHFGFPELIGRNMDLAGDLIDILSGDLNKDFYRFFRAVAAIADIPEPLPCGLPL